MITYKKSNSVGYKLDKGINDYTYNIYHIIIKVFDVISNILPIGFRLTRGSTYYNIFL